uniref:Cytochrome P450 n=1 Tax=Biomphalaria glabrata TaxID=6526 RepID=A0A2C9LM80_BIOGL
MAEKTAFKIISKTLRQVINRSSSTLSHAMTSDLAVPGSTVRSFDEIPGPTGLHRWPVIGTLLNFQPFTEFTAENTYQLLRSMYLQYGPIFRLKLGEDTVVLTDPEDVGTVYANEGRCPLRPNLSLRDAYARRNGLTLRDVSTLQGEEWQALRSPLNKLLVRVNAATHYLPAQSQVADDLVNSLAREHLTAEKISELLFRFSAESIGVVCFNSRLGLLRNINEDNAEIQQFLQAAKDNFTALHDSLTGKSLAHTLYRNTTYTQYENSMIVLSQYSRKLISQARQKLDQHRNEQSFNPEKHNLLNSLLSDKSLDDESVSQILESLFIGGTDSTAGSIAALFYNLARNPDKQDKLAAEVKQCTGSASQVAPEMISRMHYLKACVKESFRLDRSRSQLELAVPNVKCK